MLDDAGPSEGGIRSESTTRQNFDWILGCIRPAFSMPWTWYGSIRDQPHRLEQAPNESAFLNLQSQGSSKSE